jgi:hypothetical protein
MVLWMLTSFPFDFHLASHSKSNSCNIHLMVGNLGLKCVLNGYSYVQYSFEELG